MGVAYVILAHKNPAQVKRLVLALKSESSSFFIHIDQRADAVYQQLKQELASVPNVHFTPRYKCWWGSFEIVKAAIVGLETALKSRLEFTHAVLLSGQDYPIKPVSAIEDFFADNSEKQFFEYFPLYAHNRWDDMQGSYAPKQRIEHWHFMIRSKFFHIPNRRKFPLGHVPYGGSQWWALSRECAAYVVGFIQNNPKYVRFMSHVFIPDDFFFQCIVMNSPLRYSVVNDHLRFIDWENPNPLLPATILTEHFDRLAQDPALFARKFDIERDPGIMDLIDQKILHR